MHTMLSHGLTAALLLCLPMFGPSLVWGLRPEWMKAGELIGYSAMLLCLSATFFAMRAERQRRPSMRFGALLATGVGVSLVAGLVFGLASWLAFTAWGAAGVDALMQYYAGQLREAGGSPEQLAQGLRELEAMRPVLENRPLQGAVMAATVFVVGVAESLLGAWYWSRRTAPPYVR